MLGIKCGERRGHDRNRAMGIGAFDFCDFVGVVRSLVFTIFFVFYVASNTHC